MIPFAIEDSITGNSQVSQQRNQAKPVAGRETQGRDLFAQTLYPADHAGAAAKDLSLGPDALKMKNLEAEEVFPENPLAGELLRLAQNPKMPVELKKWGQVLQENDLLKTSTVLPYLAGGLSDDAKINLVIKNSSLVNQALGENLDEFFATPMPLRQLVAGVDLDLSLLDAGEKLGLNPGQNITPLEFFKALGVDPSVVKYQINSLKEKLGSGRFEMLSKAPSLGAGSAKGQKSDPTIDQQANGAKKKSLKSLDQSLLANQATPANPGLLNNLKSDKLTPQGTEAALAQPALTKQIPDLGIPLKDGARHNQAASPSELKLSSLLSGQGPDLGLKVSEIAFNPKPTTEKDLAQEPWSKESISFLDGLALKKEIATLAGSFDFAKDEEKDDGSEKGSALELEPTKLVANQAQKTVEAFDASLPSDQDSKASSALDQATKQEALLKIADKINLTKQMNKSEAVISFEDKTLGQLSMQIQIDGQEVKIQTNQGHEALRDWLGSDFSELKDSLSRQSLKLVEVASGRDFGQRQEGQGWQFFGQNGERRPFTPPNDKDEELIKGSRAFAGYARANPMGQISRSLNSRHIQLAV